MECAWRQKKGGMLRHHGHGLKLYEKVSKVLLKEEGNVGKKKTLKNKEKEYKLLYF